MTKKYMNHKLKNKSKSRSKRRNSRFEARGTKLSRTRSNSFDKSRVTPVSSNFPLASENRTLKLSPKRPKLNLSNESFERKSRVTPLPDSFPLPMDSPFETLSPNMFRLIYEGDMKKKYDNSDGSLFVDFDLPSYDSIDKPGRFPENIYQRPNKLRTPYDIENPNPFWTNSNEDYGQFVELSKSASPNLARGITKRKYKRHNKHNKLTNKKYRKSKRSRKNIK